MCLLAIVLWAGMSVPAQGQGKKGNRRQSKDRKQQAGQVQENPQEQAPAAENNGGKGKASEKAADQGQAAEKNAGKGQAAAKNGGKGKNGGPQGKKTDAAATDASAKGQGKGKGQEKQSEALQKQLQHEQAKHLERQARLNRIRELAVKKGDAEMVARVDKLIAQEKQVYDRKLGHTQGQPRATQTPGAPSDGKGKDRPGAGATGEPKEKSGPQAQEQGTQPVPAAAEPNQPKEK